MKSSSVSLRVIRGGLSSLLFGICVALAALPSAASAKEGNLSLVRIHAGWRDAASFKRISEYFDGKENTGGEAVLRTHPARRDGYYFLVRAANPGAPLAATARLSVITAADAKPREFTFTPALRSGETVFHLGLTGPDWPDAKADPVAWKLDLTGADGKVLASAQSYLWEKPAGK